jgi:hypothetical protein
MNEFGRIDDPLEASFAAWPEEESGPATEAALTVGEILSDYFGIAAVIRDRFVSKNRAQRVIYLLQGVRLKFLEMEKRIGDVEDQVKAVKAKIAAPEFQEAAAVAAEEAARAVSSQKIDQFTSILVASIDPAITELSSADAATLIRDVAQLGGTDLKILNLLESAYFQLFTMYPNVHDPNVFTEDFDKFKNAILLSGLHAEEFKSLCDRLQGFGLASEVLRNPSRMSPSDFCYRPTRRGLKLLKLLGRSRTDG